MLDAKLILSDDQAITTSADSTNVIDLGAYEEALGEEENLRLKIVVSEDFDSAAEDGTLKIQCLHSNESESKDPPELWSESTTFPENVLVAGYTIMDIGLPTYHQRYMSVYYIVAGSGNFTSGKVNAYIYAR